MRLLLPSLCCAVFLTPLFAQTPVTANGKQSARDFERDFQDHLLACRIDTRKPLLDYSFRYEIGYSIHCLLAQFGGQPAHLELLLRVTPEGAAPRLFAQSFEIPAAPANIKPQIDGKHFRAEIVFSGVYAAGVGSYMNEIVVVDEQHRGTSKAWHADTGSAEPVGPRMMALQPGVVEPFDREAWSACSNKGRGLRLTVLLDAASASPYAARLRPWDRAFLLGALSSLLRTMPLAAVRVVAFNINQQQALFREDDFQASSIVRLADALSHFSLGTVSYDVLRQEHGPEEFLSGLLQSENARQERTNAVIFLGSAQHRRKGQVFDRPIQTRLRAPVYYFQYSPHPGAEFPDILDRLIGSGGITTFRVHSPGDYATSISTLEEQIENRLQAGP